MRDIDEEESWIKEKKLLVSSDDYGMLSHDLFALKKTFRQRLGWRPKSAKETSQTRQRVGFTQSTRNFVQPTKYIN